MKTLKTLFIVIFPLIIYSCGDDNTRNEPIAKDKSTRDSKIPSFNNPQGLSDSLSSIGIGNVGEWKDLTEMDMGYCCLTPYYEFGPSGKIMANNITIGLNSNYSNLVQDITIVLNINNPNQYNKALSKFLDVTKRTFLISGIAIPDNLESAILNKKPGNYQFKDGIAALSVEKSKIDSWKIKIIGD